MPGVACDCRMLFEIQEMNRDETSVELTMEYEPVNDLGTFAIPVLTIDNALAFIKVLLPYRLQQMNATPLVKFQQLMGILYGIAGVAHFADFGFRILANFETERLCTLWRVAMEWSSSGTHLVCCRYKNSVCLFTCCGTGECRIDWIWWFDGSVLRCTHKLNNNDVIDESIVERTQRSNSRSSILYLLIKKEP
mmetsp:Transcript_7680/g.14033  ORF Transcript_7680/g.14033 Transcript_7680/m.14033 type:complete len:193 (+) Transcript_7680:351-929(+)